MSAKYTFLAWDTPINNPPLKLALLQLANNADDNGFSYYSISRMAAACGMSEKTFQRKIKEMEDMGILRVERRANRTSLYSLIGDEMGVTLCPLQNKNGATESLQGATESLLVSDRESHDPNNYPNTPPNNNNISGKSDKFIKPTVEQIKQYCLKRKNKVDPEKFFDYYESKGWKVGKSSMKDWQAAVRNWERNNYNSPVQQQNQQSGFDIDFMDAELYEDKYS